MIVTLAFIIQRGTLKSLLCQVAYSLKQSLKQKPRFTVKSVIFAA
jgi:hypothetical protein